ncbi:dTMP kinase [Streptomyces sp. NPDC087568]|uniref:dTMP kinase n=1 Tax=unclassified Streptomyces TaxID=2593676 RepID=UPI00382E953F
MTGERTGFFVTIDGPSGVGKSTTVAELGRLLIQRGVSARMITQPSTSDLGCFLRKNADHYHGLALACLVAANRYEHIGTEISPWLRTGELLICDRYVASTLVLQQLDGVPLDFLAALNEHAVKPDLAVILTATPGLIAGRITERGITHRFHRDPSVPGREVELYHDAAAFLTSWGVNVLVLDTSAATPSEVASRIADAIPPLPLPSVASATHPTPRKHERTTGTARHRHPRHRP